MVGSLMLRNFAGGLGLVAHHAGEEGDGAGAGSPRRRPSSPTAARRQLDEISAGSPADRREEA
jgi:hypothetical protein